MKKTIVIILLLISLINFSQIVGNILLVYLGCSTATFELFILNFSSFFLTLVGILIAYNFPKNKVAWILLAAGFGMPGSAVQEFYVQCNLTNVLSLPYFELVAWISHRLTLMFILPLLAFLPAVFPTGKFLTNRWRNVWLSIFLIFSGATFVTLFAPDLRMINAGEGSFPLDSPIGWSGLPLSVYEFMFSLQSMLILILTLLSIVSMVFRLLRSTGLERQQMKWFTYFIATAVSTQVIFFELPINIFGEGFTDYIWYQWAYNLIILVVFAGFPLIIGVAILQYRLYDIDIIIRRTLVYSFLTILLGFVYFGTVVSLQTLIGQVTAEDSPIVIVLSTLLIAVLFSPLRRRIQAFIDRRFYRRNYDSAQALAQFAAAARDEVDVERLSAVLLGVVEETIQPEETSLWLKKPGDKRVT